MLRKDTTDSWTYSTNAYRFANASTANRLEMVIGVSEMAVIAYVIHTADNSAGVIPIQSVIGLDDQTNVSSSCLFGRQSTPAAANKVTVTSIYIGFPGIGLHSLNWLEINTSGTATTTWYGDGGGGSGGQSGITGIMWG
jgi:hypothetical protein